MATRKEVLTYAEASRSGTPENVIGTFFKQLSNPNSHSIGARKISSFLEKSTEENDIEFLNLLKNKNFQRITKDYRIDIEAFSRYSGEILDIENLTVNDMKYFVEVDDCPWGRILHVVYTDLVIMVDGTFGCWEYFKESITSFSKCIDFYKRIRNKQCVPEIRNDNLDNTDEITRDLNLLGMMNGG